MQTVISLQVRERFSFNSGLVIHIVSSQKHPMISSDGYYLRMLAVQLLQMAVKMGRSIQNAFRIIKYPLPSSVIPQQPLQHLLWYQKRKVKEDAFDDLEGKNKMDNGQLVEDVLT